MNSYAVWTLGVSTGAVSYRHLDTGKFVNMEAEARKSQTMIFLLPLAAVLPWSDSFLLERQGGFLKSALPRTGRRVYVESKVFTVALGGFLAVFLAGTLMFFIYFAVFFPLEEQGRFPWNSVWELTEILLRCGMLGGIISTFGGICGCLLYTSRCV